jgi:hypothetical protein
MKKTLIFDMDGVLLAPRGYHLALQETVRLDAEKLGYPNTTLTDEHIAQFEGLGISSEWHSSAAALSMLAFDGKLSLDGLFESLKRQPVQIPARIRLKRSIEELTGDMQRILESETIQSPSTRVFQELILGSADFERIYGVASSLDVESYFLQFDRPLLETSTRERLLAWLAQEVGGETVQFLKPNAAHALAALLRSTGRGLQESLLGAHELLNGASVDGLDVDEIVVFEDTPGGLISVGAMGELLREQGMDVMVKKIGITNSPVKGEFLRMQGAEVFDDVNKALETVL